MRSVREIQGGPTFCLEMLHHGSSYREMIRAEISVVPGPGLGNGSRLIPLPITDDATVKPITKQGAGSHSKPRKRGLTGFETTSVDTGAAFRISRF